MGVEQWLSILKIESGVENETWTEKGNIGIETLGKRCISTEMRFGTWKNKFHLKIKHRYLDRNKKLVS